MLYGPFHGKLVGPDEVSDLPYPRCLRQRSLPSLRDATNSILASNFPILTQREFHFPQWSARSDSLRRLHFGSALLLLQGEPAGGLNSRLYGLLYGSFRLINILSMIRSNSRE